MQCSSNLLCIIASIILDRVGKIEVVLKLDFEFLDPLLYYKAEILATAGGGPPIKPNVSKL